LPTLKPDYRKKCAAPVLLCSCTRGIPRKSKFKAHPSAERPILKCRGAAPVLLHPRHTARPGRKKALEFV